MPLFTASPEEYGLVGLLVALEGIGTNLMIVGQDRSIIRFYFHEERQKIFLSTVYLICFAAALPLLFGLLGASFFSGTVAGIPIYPHLVMLMLAVLLLNLNKLYFSVLRVEENARRYAGMRVSFAVLKGLCVLLLVMQTKNSIAYVGGLLLAAALIFGATLPYIRERVARGYDPRTAKKLWLFGWPFIFHLMAGNILMFADRFMIESYLGLSEVGTYTLAYTLGSAVVFIYGALSIYFEPLIYRNAGSNQTAEELMSTYSLVCLFLGTLWGGMLLLGLPYIVERIWGPSYTSIFGIVPVILAAHLLMPIYQQANYRLTLHEKTKALAFGTVLAAISNVLLNLVLIPGYGTLGAAIATYFSLLVLCVVVFYASLKSADVHYKVLKSPLILGVTIVGTLLVVFVRVYSFNIAVFLALTLLIFGTLWTNVPAISMYMKKFNV